MAQQREAQRPTSLNSTLAGLEAAVRLVDDVQAALAADDAVVAMTRPQRLEGIFDFHLRAIRKT
jgi:hypothetical protein